MTRILHDPELNLWRDQALAGAYLTSARYGEYEFERHVHDELVIAITEEGAGQCRTRFGQDISGPDSVWIFAPGEYHSGRVWDIGKWIYRAIYIDALGLSELKKVFCSDGPGELQLAPGLYRDPQLARMLLKAHQSSGAALPLLERQMHWWAAMGLLFGRYGQPKLEQQALGGEPSKMALVKDFIAANYLRELSIEELATLCGLSRHHLIRSFTREYGLPPHAYLSQLRLHAAKRLLLEGNSLAQAALAAGFYDQSHLTKLFKRNYGVTPGTYVQALGVGRNQDTQTD